jgi:hypothetical protein
MGWWLPHTISLILGFNFFFLILIFFLISFLIIIIVFFHFLEMLIWQNEVAWGRGKCL